MRLFQSAFDSLPTRSRLESTLPSVHMRRVVTSSRDISSEKIATGICSRTARWVAMLSASDVLPMPGRAARTIRFDFWNPAVSSSRARKPDGAPVMSWSEFWISSSRSNDCLSRPSMRSKSPEMRWSAIEKTICSARSTSSCGSPTCS